MYDFLISLTLFLKKKNIDKIKILMKLMDVDEDFCLSILEIKQMLGNSFNFEEISEKNFIMISSFIKNKDPKILKEIAIRKANRNFHSLFNFKYVDKEDELLDQFMITFQEFEEILLKKTIQTENLLPLAYDYNSFFTFKIEPNIIQIQDKVFPDFVTYCKQFVIESPLESTTILPKIMIMSSDQRINTDSSKLKKFKPIKRDSKTKHTRNKSILQGIWSVKEMTQRNVYY